MSGSEYTQDLLDEIAVLEDRLNKAYEAMRFTERAMDAIDLDSEDSCSGLIIAHQCYLVAALRDAPK